ncbi:hypothetical protein D9601_06550 [Sphingomonas sp. MA1305]|uniref:hypothetical protein n=1 Tax=Sphingomonas sp. MA1305 TaxID=2479204 RepID=UPI0018DFADE3|nr:hypothetical protein [Sphingomonas sp. MA1305]MBI0475019.1 hypothetical protein [Sphingomonas sp. MA1305]
MSARARFRQEDVTRALKGAVAAGMRVGRIEIDPNGRIVILSETAAPTADRNSWDDVLPV